ncbi:hypothetical protein HKX48_006482 [Thoreauomyces humboldtii]|nr:hypothetical protein HKX48_006482 [Thoreauomyces humboldtii]
MNETGLTHRASSNTVDGGDNVTRPVDAASPSYDLRQTSAGTIAPNEDGSRLTTFNGTPIHHPVVRPRDDIHRKEESYVAYEKAGIEGGQGTQHFEDEEDDAIARAINSVVPQTDDPATPVWTFRVFVLGSFWSILMCLVNVVFSFRTAPIAIGTPIITLLSYPMGQALARVLPRGAMNPGPWNMKEHVLIVLMASAAASTNNGGVPYGLDNVVAQKMVALQDVGFGAAFGWIFCTQMIGLGFAGVLRRFLVWPREMSWPGNFSNLALFASYWQDDDALAAEGAEKYKLSRYTFFWLAFLAIFVYEWFPLYIMPVLQAVSLLCWFTKNTAVKRFGSASAGMGALTIAFDWQFILSAWMTTPFWVTALMTFGNVFWYLILVPICNSLELAGWNNQQAGERAYNTSAMYDKDGEKVSKGDLFNPDYTSNETFLAAHEPFTLSTYFYLNYMVSFFNLTACLSHVYLWYGPQIVRQTRAMLKGAGREGNDVHNTLMRAYSEVPEWQYLILIVVTFVGVLVVGETTVFVMPWWSVFLATGITCLFIIPIGIIQSITGMQIGLNVVTELVSGFLLPGHTITVMCFKSYGYNVMIQAMTLLSDLKLGHYLHIPPKAMFWTQLYGNALGALVSSGSVIWVIEKWGPTAVGGSNLINTDSKSWSFSNYALFFNAGAIFGGVGPKAFFGTTYNYGIYYAFLAGAILPIIPWVLNKYWPSRWFIYMNFAVLSTGYGTWGVGYQQNYIWSSLFVGWLFQFYLYRSHYAWWSKYNYVLGAALDAGTAVCIIATTVVLAYASFPLYAGNPGNGQPGEGQFGDRDWWCDDINGGTWRDAESS